MLKNSSQKQQVYFYNVGCANSLIVYLIEKAEL